MDTEVCIVGGGLVGLTAAIAFAQQGRTVKLLEAFSLRQGAPAELDVRSIALSYSTVQIFSALGLWDSVQENAAAITDVHVSSAGHFGVTRLNAKDCQLDVMGYVIEYHILIEALLGAVEKEQSIELMASATVTDVQQNETSVSLQYVTNQQTGQLQASVLLVADGANSSVRKMLTIGSSSKDYEQVAIVANLKLKQSSNHCAYERFTRHGPLALLPLPDQRYAMVWTNPAQKADALMAMSDAEFIEQVYRQFGYRLGLFEQVGMRGRFDLKLNRADKLVSGRAVLIGNAANSLHPVAGQGFNLALRDIGLLFDLLSSVDLQTDQVQQQLDRYQQQRVTDQNQAVQYGNGLVQLFSNNLPLLNHLRAGALAALDLCPVLKNEVSWQGMGYGSGCSSLMRGTS